MKFGKLFEKTDSQEIRLEQLNAMLAQAETNREDLQRQLGDVGSGGSYGQEAPGAYDVHDRIVATQKKLEEQVAGWEKEKAEIERARQRSND